MKIAYGIGDGETSELCERLIFILRASLLCVYNFIVTTQRATGTMQKKILLPISLHVMRSRIAAFVYFCTFIRLRRYERIVCMPYLVASIRTEGQVYLFIVRMHMRKCYFSDFMNAFDHIYFSLEDFRVEREISVEIWINGAYE